jgi:pimeloyl-ACP methyl ester carboxylesterase
VESRQPVALNLMNHAGSASGRRPSLALLGAEPLRAAMEFAAHLLPTSGATGPGDGHAVVIFPGLGANGSSTATLREHCRSLGFQALDWGQGSNTGPEGDLDTWLEALKGQVEELLSGHRQPATLIGWSLGGIYARELGKLMALRLRQVITIGTPFNADADHSDVGWLFRVLNGRSTAEDPALSRRLRTPPPVPTTSIYSRSDGVVAWQSCVHDKPFMRVQHIEVDGSHFGLGWNREVLDSVTDQLCFRPGSLRRHAAS